MNEKEIIYIDETSVNLWSYRRCLWQKVDYPIPVRLAKDRGSGLTVIGAISNKRPDMVYCIADSTNKYAVKDLILKMKVSWGSLNECVMVMDNHTAHKSHLIADFLD